MLPLWLLLENDTPQAMAAAWYDTAIARGIE
jgi:hypothetical protein